MIPRSSLTLVVILLLGLVAASFFQTEIAGALDGTDDRAMALAEAHGARPATSLPFEPDEVAERWLFVLQGLLGVGLLAVSLRLLRFASHNQVPHKPDARYVPE